MRYSEFSSKSQLPENKRRTIRELASFISVRTDDNPNYTLLLGAGCSISSGIRSGAELATMWRNEIYQSSVDKSEYKTEPAEQISYLKSNYSSWYDPTREYSSLFERKFDLQRQRRMFVEHEVANKKPSIGYAYLTALIDSGHFGTVFTTNFDDLLNESFYLYSNDRPIVCAHDSSINSITVTSRRPKIIKLHGDYLFDDIKSTARETESLEQNMKEKFIEFAKDYGLVVIGYAGGDRSIMDLLSLLLKNEDYFKGGIYWCIRSDSEVSEELKKLIWKDRVFFVEINGFDELFAEIFSQVNKGDILPLSALSVTRRPNEIINSLLSSPSMFPETSDILIAAKKKLIRQSKNFRFAESIIDQNGEKKDSLPLNGLTEDELITLSSIQKLISSGDFDQAVRKARYEFEHNNKKSLKAKILRMIVRCHRLCGDVFASIATCDELIRMQPNNANNYLLKAVCVENHHGKIEHIEKAIEVDQYSVSARIDKARYLTRLADDVHGKESEDYRNNAISELEIAIQINPARENEAWVILFDEYVKIAIGEKSKDKRINSLIDKLNDQNPYGHNVLMIRSRLINQKSNESDILKLLADIDKANDRKNGDDNHSLYELKLIVYESANMIAELETEIPLAEAKLNSAPDVDLAIILSGILRSKFGQDSKSIDILESALESYEFNVRVFQELIDALTNLERFEKANEFINKYKNKIAPHFLAGILESYYTEAGQFDLAIAEHSKKTKMLGLKEVGGLAYIHLKQGNYDLAERITREYLETCNFSTKAISENVNYEISKKKLSKKIDHDKLNLIAKSTDHFETKAAIFAIEGKVTEAVDAIREAMKMDMTFRFKCRSWPAFDEIKTENAFLHEIGRTVRLPDR